VATKIFLKFNGGRPHIRGTSKDVAHEEWIDATSVQLGDTKPRYGSKQPISEVHITRTTDSASTDLWINASQGNQFNSVTIEIWTTGIDGELKLSLKTELTVVVIADMSTHGGGSGEATESFTLVFEVAKLGDQAAGADALSTQRVRASFDDLRDMAQ
jgi:type VI protein secretion system component Hcp